MRKRGPKNTSTDVLTALLQDLNVGIANLSTTGRILYCNNRFREILGIPGLVDVVGTKLTQHLSAASWPAVIASLKKATHVPVAGDLRLEFDGGTRFVGLSLAPMHVETVTTIRAVAIDRTELVETNKALEQSRAELQSLSAKILQLRDNERRRIARDLHDVTGQELAVVLMSLGSAGRQFQATPGIGERLKESVDILRKVESEIRTLSYLLHPPLLDESGLTAALQWYVDGLAKRTGLQVHSEVGQLPRLSRDLEIALFRVVQESLTNVIRHADATAVWVRSNSNTNHLQIFIEDNGKGIDPKRIALSDKGYSGGVGIAGMDQRLRQLGGSLRVSAKRHGTVVCASAPIDATPPEENAIDVGEQVPATPSPASSSNVKRILIADDHEVTRRGIRSLLTEEKNFEICGEACNGSEAIAKTLGLQPDLIILDLIMPDVGGFTVASRIRQAGVPTKILVFTTHSFPGIEKTLRAAGCHGYVRKQVASQELVSAMHEVLRGGTYFPAEPNTLSNSASVP